MTIAELQAILLTGLVLGALYALISAGLSMVWSTLRMFNFAYGSLITLGAYLAWTATDSGMLGANMVLGVITAVIILSIIGALMERLLVAPFIKRPDAALIVIITTLAASLFLENGIQVIWGPRMKQLSRLVSGKVELFGSVISASEMIMVILAPTILVGVALFLKYTRLGMAIRAVEQNRESALLVGVNVSRIYSLTFGLSAGLAALAGIILGSTRLITPTMGSTPLLKAFIVVILGGLGSLGGTMASAFIIGLIEAASTTYLGLYWTPAVLFGIMIITLIIKPNGLFGQE